MGSKGAKDAAKAQQQGADKSAQVQWDMFNQARADNEPFRQGGVTGLQEYMALLGLPTAGVSAPTQWFGQGDTPTVNSQLYGSDPAYRAAWDQVAGNHFKVFGRGFGEGSDRNAIQGDLAMLYSQNKGSQPQAAGVSTTQQQAFDKFRSAPGYQFGLDQGAKTLQSSAAASGGLFSGKAGKALTQFGQDYADQQGYRPYMNSLAALAGIGQTAAAQNNSLGQATAGNVGNALMSAGNARASGIQNSANIWGQAAGQIGGLAGYALGNRSGSGWGWGGV
jgi:hypothetical protein